MTNGPGVTAGARGRAGAAVHGVQRGLRPAWRWALTARAQDVTAISARRSCVVLAPHPDDETLGCGATIARKVAAGSPVHVVVAADGRHSHPSAVLSPAALAAIRADEVASATAELGLGPSQLVQLGFEDAHLGDAHRELVGRLVELVGDLAPDEVLVASGRDWHPDHQALHRAAGAALAVLGEHGRRPALLAYPVWHWAEGPWGRHGPRPLARKLADLATEPLASLRGPRPVLVRTEGFLAAKRRALACHRSQVENLTGEPGWAVLDQAFLAAFLRPAELFLP